MNEGNGSGASRTGGMHREIHLKDLWAVVVRHWKLVALLAALVAGGAYFSGRNAVARYQSGLTVQISSSKQVFARMDDIDVDELALRTDPIRSEALVLTTQALALRVVYALSLQLEIADEGVHRGDVMNALTVDSLAPAGEYALDVFGAERYQLRNVATRELLASGPLAEPVVGPGFSFFAVPQHDDVTIQFRILPPELAAAWVSGGLSYRIRESTNAVDIWFTGGDRTLVPQILNQAAVELRSDGAERARQNATRRRRYISEQVARAESLSQTKFVELQRFKEDERITDLTAEEQALVQSIRDFELQRQQIQIQISTLRDALRDQDSIGVETLNRLAAVGPGARNPALDFQIQNLLELYEERRALTAGAMGLRENNPQIQGIDQRLGEAHTALEAAVNATVQSLRQREGALASRVNQLRNQLMTFPGKETRIAQLLLETSILEETHRYLLGQFQQARLQEATIAPYITILDGASPPSQIGTNLRQKVLLGLLVGLLLGLGGAFFLEYLDQTIKSASDVERATGMPVLGLIPYETKLATGSNGRRKSILVLHKLNPDDPAVEAYRALRTNVTFVAADKPLQFVAVTSPGPGEGKSTTAANLAITLAAGGSRTLLIDGDLRRPLQHRAFGLVQDPGLTDILIGRVTPREAVRPGVAEKLDVLPSGSIPPNPSELLGSEAMQRLIGALRHDYEFIVMDTPPALAVTDATIVATSADATIVVMRSGDTEEVAAQRTVDQLRRVHARIAGAVLNGVSQRHDQYYTYYSYRTQAANRTGRRKSWRSLFANL